MDQARRRQCACNLQIEKGLCLKVALAHYVYLMMVKFDVCEELQSLEVKVSIIFSGTVGFPPPMEGRYVRLYQASGGTVLLKKHFYTIELCCGNDR